MLITVANVKRNYQHVKREAANKQLINQLNKDGIVIVQGEDKTGKTELVSQYYFEHQDNYKYCLWLQAGSEDELLLELQTILNDPQTPKEIRSSATDIKNLDDCEKQLTKMFESLASSWLIVLDDLGIKDLDTFLLPLVSSRHKHHVIVTVDSTNNSLLSDQAPNPLILNKFTSHEIETLFAQRLGLQASDLSKQDKSNINGLVNRLGQDLDVLVTASRLYADKSKQAELLALTQQKHLTREGIQPKISQVRLGVNPQLLEQLKLLSFFGNQAVPSTWLPSENTQELKVLINKLKEFGVITVLRKNAQQIALESSWQGIFAQEMEGIDFEHYDRLYRQVLAMAATSFFWTRTNYDKKLKPKDQPNYPKEQAQWAELTLAALANFPAWQQKAACTHHPYPQATLLQAVKLTNSLGRYHFIQEWFEAALGYYQTAKQKFDLLLDASYKLHFDKDMRDKSVDDKLFQALLTQYGYEVCLMYAQEVLHNIGATIIKISWDKQQKTIQLNSAIKYLTLSYDWQLYLITKFTQENVNRETLLLIQQQLGLSTIKEWTKQSIAAELYHAACYTQRLLAQAYIQQKRFAKARAIFSQLKNSHYYMDRPETIPLAHRDLANVLRREGELDESLVEIGHALTSVEALKNIPAKVCHYPGEKEQVLYESTKIFLAKGEKYKENEELALAKECYKKATADLNKIIKLNSDSWLYKAKTYYQLARIAKLRKNRLDEINYIEAAIRMNKERNPLKQKVYEHYHQAVAMQETDVEKQRLTDFSSIFILEFLTQLKITHEHLKYDSTGQKINLAFGIIQSFFRLIPKNVSFAGINAEIPLADAVSDLGKSISAYRNSTRELKLEILQNVQKVLQASVNALSKLIIEQYRSQLKNLTYKDLTKQLVPHVVEALNDFIQSGKLLTQADGSNVPAEIQLMRALLDHIKKASLTTQNPKITKHWNTRSLFNKSAFFVEVKQDHQPTAIKQLYARREAKLDQHEKYGYSQLKRIPLPEDYYKPYESEADLNAEKQGSSESHCLVM